MTMKNILILLFVALGFISKAQQQTETYFKDYYLTKEVDEKKAKFKKVETIDADGTVHFKVIDLDRRCLSLERSYKDKNPVGVWATYSQNCTVEQRWDFSKLVYSKSKVDTIFNNEVSNDNSDIYEIAQFGDNEEAIFNYLATNVKYPNIAKEAGIMGRVYLHFMILADGEVKMVSILESAHAFLDYEAWEVIERMPKWKPATKNGQPIASNYYLPVKFSLK